MKNDYLIKKINYECPLCDQTHPVEIKKRISKSLVKNEPVEYEQVCYYCSIEDDEFVPAKIMDENLLRAKDAYRQQKGLLTTEQIKEIRQSYGLNQKEFSNLLGWGDVTIQRYEKKLIQDETYDNFIRMTGFSPALALELLDKHKTYFESSRYGEIRKLLKAKIKEKANENLKKQEIMNCYIEFDEKSDCNGFRELDIEKINSILGYFARYINPLYKVKLMKLLWYSDALYYKKWGSSMTGLVYQHLPMGAVPFAHHELLSLPSIRVVEELFNDFTGYRIYPNPDQEIHLAAFSLEELNILEKVASFFKEKATAEIVEYMHQEKAYRETGNGQVIPYSLAGEVDL